MLGFATPIIPPGFGMNRPQASLNVRPAQVSDLADLVRFQCAMAEETEGRSLDPEVARKGVAAVFEDPAKGQYFVVEENGRVLASLMVTREWSDWRNAWFWWIQSVYVQPQARRRGCYRRLHQEVRRQARQDPQVCGIRLYVDRQNQSAQEVYRKAGMDACDYRLYEEDYALGTHRRGESTAS
ncbi:MAG: GNAT family N-acetyltransferase [Planctomycetota bacterium]|nr:MAG: GNAT family N-acetyltransferase [Planctomycetota bacterium]